MTLASSGQTVRLSIRDWYGILAIAATVIAAVFGAYLHHDRLLTQLVAVQGQMDSRLDRIEINMDTPKR